MVVMYILIALKSQNELRDFNVPLHVRFLGISLRCFAKNHSDMANKT